MESKKLDAVHDDYIGEGDTSFARKLVMFVIPFVTVLVLGVVLGLHFDNIKDFFGGGSGEETVNEYYIGKEITVTGLLDKGQDYRVYTHTIMTQDHDVFGLKSASVNLALYEGWASVRGVIEEYYAGMYIIEAVSAVEALGVGDLYTGAVGTGTSEVATGGDVLDTSIEPSELYFPEAALLFDVTGEWDYTARSEDGRLVVSSVTDETKRIAINHFRCKVGNPNHDCVILAERFDGVAEFTVTSANGDVYYKLPEANAWFVRNGGLYGYFINGASTADIERLTQYIILPNRNYVDDVVMPQATKLCTTLEHHLVMVDRFTILERGDHVLVRVVGADRDDVSLVCELRVDFASDLTPMLVSVRASDEPVAPVRDMDGEYIVEQVAVDLANVYEFTSSRGHTIVFPSKNISFGPGENEASVSLDGARCYSHMNVVAYADAALLDTDPAMRIFECTVNDDIVNFGEYRYLQSADGKQFLVVAVKPSWEEFVDNVVIR